MDYLELIDKLRIYDAARIDIINEKYAEFIESFGEDEKIRIAILDSPNFGHQTNALLILRLLLNILDCRNSNIEVCFDVTNPNIYRKLHILIPFFNFLEQYQEIAIDGKTVVFDPFYFFDDEPDENIKLGFCGGNDFFNATINENSVNLAELINTQFALSLQPFKWHITSGLDYIKGEKYKNVLFDKSIIENKNSEGYHLSISQVDINNSGFYNFTYCFKDYMLNIPDGAKDFYTKSDNKSFLSKAVEDADNIICKLNETALFLPVYGLHTLTNENDAKEFIANSITFIVKLFISVLYSYKNEKIEKPVLMLLFNDFNYYGKIDSKDNFEIIKEFIISLLREDKDRLSRIIESLFLPAEIEETKKSPYINNVAGTFNSLKECVDFNIDMLVFINDTSEASLSAVNEKKLYIYSIKSVPSCYFNYFYNNAGLPAIFEGQGTVPVVMASGKPYIQFNSNNGEINSYLFNPSKKDKAEDFQKIANSLERKAIKYINETETYSIVSDTLDVCIFMLNVLSKDRELLSFFTENKNYVNDIRNDKFHNGIGLMQLKINELNQDKLRINTESPLESIYTILKNSISENILNFYEALSGYYVAEYLKISIESFSIKVRDDSLSIEYDEKNNIKAVIINNASSFVFGSIFNTYISFKYTEYDNNIVCTSIELLADSNENIDIIPWIDIKAMGITIIVSEDKIIAENYFSVGFKDLDLVLNGKILNENVLYLQGYFEKPFSSLDLIYKLVGNYNFTQYLPDTIKDILNIGISYMSFYFDIEKKSLYEISIQLKPIDGGKWIFVKNPELSVEPTIMAIIHKPLIYDKRSVSFIISGDFKIGDGNINVSAVFPEGEISANLTENTIKFSDIIKLFDSSIEMDEAFEISQFSMTAIPTISYYSVRGTIDISWKILCFEIENLSLGITKRGNNFFFYVSGTAAVLPESAKAEVKLLAYYNSNNGWVFNGGLSEEKKPLLSELFKYYLGFEYTERDFPLLNLELTVESKTKAWKFDAFTAEPWSVPFISDMDINAFAEIGRKSDGSYFGRIEGDIKWNGIDLKVWYKYDGSSENDLSAANNSQSFGITWEDLTAEVEEKNDKWTAEIYFSSSTSLGFLISKMIGWLKNSDGYMLDSPWDVLNNISLSNFSLIYDFTNKNVSFQIKISEINLGIAQINEIGLEYKTEEGVILTLKGSFAWQTGDTLSWDASDPDTAPNPIGGKYFDLRLLSIGQHCNIPNLYNSNNVDSAIAAIEAFADKGELPLYDENNNWFFGADFGVLKFKDEKDYFINIKTVLCDSSLYALSVRLTGKAAKVFENFEFEILYKKLSSNLGVFQGEITLPDSIRYLNIGAYKLTLPIFGVAVYTNGDFKVDFGFPYNNNYSRCFAVEAIIYPGIPLTGAAGFYFAKLSQYTAANMLPDKTSGYYNPVIAFGFGIKAGFGKSLSLGVLDAKFELIVFGIIEGVYAVFNSYKDSNSSGDYFYLSGTMGITGMLYASVDFCIIKAYVDISVLVYAQIVYSTETPMIFTVAVQLAAKAGLKLNFGLFKVNISFSFSINLKETFKLGSSNYNSPVTLFIRSDESYTLNWGNLEESTEKTYINGIAAMALTAAADALDGNKIKPYCIVALFVKSGEPFKNICEKVSLWIAAAFESGKVSADSARKLKLDENKLDFIISDYLDSQTLMPVSAEDIEKFIDEQFKFVFATKPASDNAENVEAVYFPVPESLNISSEGLGIDYDISEYSFLNSKKLAEISEYFKQLVIAAKNESVSNDLNDKKYSVGLWIFADYFTFLIKEISETLKKFLRTYNYKNNGVESIDDILDWIRENSTAAYEISNIAQANKEHKLTENIKLKINGEAYITGAGETLKSIAESKNMTAEEIAKENSSLKGIFSKESCIVLPHLGNLSVKALLNAENTDDEFCNIEKLISRMYYNGIRFSTEGICCVKTLPKESGLYYLTGQQIEIPSETKEDLIINLKFKESLKAYSFDNSNSAEFTINTDSDDAKRISAIYKAGNNMDTINLENFNVSDLRLISPYSSSCTSSIMVDGLSFDLPYGGESDDIKIWYVPDGILNMSKNYASSYSLKLSQYDDSKGTTQIYDTDKYGYVSLIKFKIAKIDNIENTYQIAGSSQNDIDILTGIMSKNLSEESISDLSLYFSKKIEKSNFTESNVLFGITRSNLSYNTVDKLTFENGVINDKTDFIKLLWEALVTNIGGYYLYYYNKDEKRGLLESIFNEYKNAEINVVILYSAKEGNKINFFKNAVITGNKIYDGANVFLEAVLSNVTVKFKDDDTAEGICERYNSDITVFADNNKDKKIKEDCTIKVERGKFIVDDTYNTLSKIASHFYVSKDDLINANKELTLLENSEKGTVLKIPMIFVKPIDTGLNTLSDIADYFGCLTSDIIYSNKDIKGVFSGQNVTVTIGPLNINSSSEAGVMSISGKREKPEDADDYTEEFNARKYLLNNYSLLSYMIEDNQYFKSSNNSLSFSPYEDGEKWMYNTSFNYFEFAKNVSKLNCYSSIDRLLKFKFKWIDLYGNEFWKSPGESAVLTGYSDKITALSEWTSAGYGYKVVKCGNRPVFEFILTFDSDRYDNMGKDELKGIISRYQKLYLQLNDENGIRVYINASIFASEENMVFEFDGERIESLKKWLFGDNSVYSYIWNKYNDTEASAPDKLTVSFDIEINSNYTEKQIFELNVSFIISRIKNAVMGGLYTLNGISKAETIIPPLSEKKDNEETLSYYKFACAYEEAFETDDYIIRIIAGNQSSLHGIKIGKNSNAVSFKFEDNPVLWAVRPISNTLKSCDNPICIYGYKSGEGITKEIVNTVKAENVDLDQLMKKFLEILDSILSPKVINSIFVLDKYYNTGNLCDTILENKKKVAGKLKNLVSAVADSQRDFNKERAEEYLNQQLLISLSRLYSIGSIVEYGVNVSSQYTNIKTAPNIYGCMVFDSKLPKSVQCSQMKINLADSKALFCIFAPEIVKDCETVVSEIKSGKITFIDTGIENDITYIDNIDGYYFSDNLKYVTDNKISLSKETKETNIPLPLKSYPDKPIMTSQSKADLQYDNIFEWNYKFDYRLNYHYPQDLLECTIETNVNEKLNDTNGDDKFTENIIRFLNTYSNIENDINEYVSVIKSDSENEETVKYAVAAIKSFNELSTAVIDSFNSDVKYDMIKNNNDIKFSIRESSADIDGTTALVIEVSDENAKILVSPDKYDIQSYSKNSYVYVSKETGEYLSSEDGQSIKERTVVYEGFNLFKIQNAKGELELKRNEEIITGQKTNDDFVYNTGVISFENAYFPLICNYEKIDISLSSQKDKDTVSNYLKAWFNNLIPDDNNVSIQMQVYYSYNLNSAFDNVKYPIFMKSIEKCSKEQLLNNCRSWGEYIENWKKNNINEYIENSEYLFDIIIYSSYSDKPKPLLHMTNVVLPTNKIDLFSNLNYDD